MKLNFLNSHNTEPHRLAYYEYGNPCNKAVVLLHAFSHNAKFFHEFAEYLSKKGLYVICPDMPGRGESEYLKNPRNYNYWLYVDDLFFILTCLKIETVTLLGNSMGGITSILFTEKFPKLVNKIILNDIGLFVPCEESMRIGGFIAKDICHKTQEDIVKRILAELEQSALRPEDIKKVLNAYTILDESGYRLNYDPNIGEAFWIRDRQKRIPDLDFTDNFQNLSSSNKSLEVYLIKGEKSNLLNNEEFEKIKCLNNVKGYLEVPGKGHLPLFFNNVESDYIASWILR